MSNRDLLVLLITLVAVVVLYTAAILADRLGLL